MSRIAVVGGGFAGLYAAYKLASAGHRVVLFEEHRDVGLPRHCTGLVSGWVVDKIGGPAREVVRGEYKVYRMRVDGDASLELVLGDPSYRLERVLLEKKLLERVLGMGVEVRLGCRVSGVGLEGRVESCSGGSVYDAVVVATGFLDRRNMSLPHELDVGWEPRVVWGLNVEALRGDTPGEGVVDILLDGWNGGFFYWSLRTQDGVLVGGASYTPPTKDMLVEMYGLEDIVGVYGGPVLTGPPHPRPWAGRVFLVGDIAGHNKPLTGGGLFPIVFTVECMAFRSVEDWPDCLRATARMLSRQVPLARLFQGVLDRDGIISLLSSVGERVRVGSFDRHEGLLGWEGIGRWMSASLRLLRKSPGTAFRVAGAVARSVLYGLW